LLPETSSAPTASDPVEDDDRSASPPFLSLREAAEWLCVSVSTIKRLIANSELPTVRIGKRQKISASTLAAYVSRDVLLPEQVQKSLDQT
jgi:excisionase family DNA binding protein